MGLLLLKAREVFHDVLEHLIEIGVELLIVISCLDRIDAFLHERESGFFVQLREGFPGFPFNGSHLAENKFHLGF